MSKLYKHHIVPKHSGGDNSKENIKLVTLEQHAEEHKILWEKNGLIQDYIAWKCLSGQIKSEDIINFIRSENGKIQGRKNVDSGHMTRIQKLSDLSQAGKKGAEVCRTNKKIRFLILKY